MVFARHRQEAVTQEGPCRRFYPQELGDNLDAKKVLSTIMNCDILEANHLKLKSTALKLAFGFGRGEKSRKPDL